MAGTSAPSDPKVPGPLGACPQPSLVGRTSAVFCIRFVFSERRRNPVLFRRPLAQVDKPAPIGAERHMRVVQLHRFLANRTPHTIIVVWSDFPSHAAQA